MNLPFALVDKNTSTELPEQCCDVTSVPCTMKTLSSLCKKVSLHDALIVKCLSKLSRQDMLRDHGVAFKLLDFRSVNK
jgi:hypothetical protein